MTGDQLRKARQRLGLTQVELAAVLGVTGETCSRWERDAVPISEPAARFVAHLVSEHAPAPQQTKRGGHRR